MPNLKPVSSHAKDRDYVDHNKLINLSLKPKQDESARQRLANKRAVNYHTRDLNQYPFFNYSKRRQSHGVSSQHPMNGAVTSQNLYSNRQRIPTDSDQPAAQKSAYDINTMPALFQGTPTNARSQARSISKDSRMFKNIKLGSSTTKAGGNGGKVAYWAGLRVEGGLNPFGRNADEMTQWNDKINNGGLFEKIGSGLKRP